MPDAISLYLPGIASPRLDGSTSTVPLGQTIASALLGKSRESVSDLTQFPKTSQSYRNLINGRQPYLQAELGTDYRMDSTCIFRYPIQTSSD